MSDTPKIVNLGTPDELKASIAKMTRQQDEMIEYFKLMAKIRREYYLELINQGFTAQQAIELCKGVG